MNRDAGFDAIAARVIEARVMSIDDATADIDARWIASRAALENALKSRGVDMSPDGSTLSVPEATFGATHPDYSRFGPAVAAALQTSDRPIDTDSLLGQLQLPDSNIPFASVSRYLREAGLWHIPGIGWWTDPQWCDPIGNVFSVPSRTPRVRTILLLFNEFGWPLSARQIELMSQRRAEASPALYVPVNRGFLSPNRRHQAKPYFRNIGLTLIVPAAEYGKSRVPMSPSMAVNMLSITPDDLLVRDAYSAVYGIAYLMARHGLADVVLSQTRRSGISHRTARLTINDRGRDELKKLAQGMKSDAVEVI